MNRYTIENYELAFDQNTLVLTFDLNDWTEQKAFLANKIPEPEYYFWEDQCLCVTLGKNHGLIFPYFPKSGHEKALNVSSFLLCGINDAGIQMAEEITALL